MAIPVVIVVDGLLAAEQEARSSTSNSNQASLSHNNTLTPSSVTLTLSGHTGDWGWYYVPNDMSHQFPGLPSNNGIDSICRPVSGSKLTLIPSTGPYQVFAFTDKENCGPTSTAIGDITFSAPAITLSVVDGTVTATSMNLTTNHSGTWYYKHNQTGASCVSAGTKTTVTAADLTANTSYIFKVYSDSSCSDANELATASATSTLDAPPGRAARAYLAERPGKIRIWWQTPTGATKVRVQRAETKGNWDNAVTVENDASIGTVQSSGLGNGTTYYFRLSFKKSTSDWGPWIVLKGTPGPEAFNATAVTQNGATLTLSKYDGWGNLHYSDPLPELENRELPIEGAAVNNWSYKQTLPSGGQCVNVDKEDGTTVTVDDLTAGTAYTFKAYSNHNCNTEMAMASFTTPKQPQALTATAALSIPATSTTQTTALLTITNHKRSTAHSHHLPQHQWRRLRQCCCCRCCRHPQRRRHGEQKQGGSSAKGG